MKKLMFAAALATVCGAVQADAISSDIVGYTTLNITKQYTLLTIGFDKVGGGGIDIQDAFPYGDGMTKGLNYTTADNIQIMMSDGGYETYFLSNGHYGKGGASYNADLDGKWSAPGTNAATTDKFPAGTGAFYLSRSKSGSVTFVSPIQ